MASAVALALALAAGLTASPALAQHVHGEAKLAVVIEASTLTIEFSAPLGDLAGFEHEPKTPEEKAKAASIAKTLGDSASIVTVPAQAGCKPAAAKIDGLSGHDDHDHGDSEDHHGDHSDVVATYTLTCSKLASLRAVDIPARKTFPSISTIQATVLGPQKQTSQKLSGKTTELRLR
jgi:hypothetical protein